MKRSSLVRRTPLQRTAPKPKPRQKLSPVSKKRAVLNRAYERSKATWRKQHDGRCEMMLTLRENMNLVPTFRFNSGLGFVRCRCRADRNPHHAAGRLGALLCDIRYFVGLCNACHRWVHDNAKEAERLGYIIRKP